jgi:hypothetical protein
MARKKDVRHLGAKRMWIRRWTHAKKISKAEAKRFLKHLEKTGKLLRPTKIVPLAKRVHTSPAIAVAGPGELVTIQYDPSRFRVEIRAIRKPR